MSKVKETGVVKPSIFCVQWLILSLTDPDGLCMESRISSSFTDIMLGLGKAGVIGVLMILKP